MDSTSVRTEPMMIGSSFSFCDLKTTPEEEFYFSTAPTAFQCPLSQHVGLFDALRHVVPSIYPFKSMEWGIGSKTDENEKFQFPSTDSSPSDTTSSFEDYEFCQIEPSEEENECGEMPIHSVGLAISPPDPYRSLDEVLFSEDWHHSLFDSENIPPASQRSQLSDFLADFRYRARIFKRHGKLREYAMLSHGHKCNKFRSQIYQ